MDEHQASRHRQQLPTTGDDLPPLQLRSRVASIMWYQLLADGVMLLHLGFVLFAVFGGLLALRWPKVVWVHLPAATWGAAVEFTGWICPLTPLEVWLRLKGGESGYDADFIAQHVLPMLYPAGLTHDLQIMLGWCVVAANVVVYGWVWRCTFKAPSLSRHSGSRK